MKIIFGLFFLVITPLIAYASEEGSVEPHMMWRIIDFVVFAAIIYYFVKNPIVNYFRTRKETIENTLKEAEALKAEAEGLLKETEEQLSKLDDEIKKISETFSSMAKNEKENILKEAKLIVKRMKDMIEEEKSSMLSKAKLELLRKMAKDTIANVRNKMHQLTIDEHNQINKNFIRSITQ